MNDGYETYELGRQAMQVQMYEEASEFFRKSTLLCPHFKAFELLGECLVKLKRYNEAIGPLAAAVTLNNGVRAASLLAEAFLAIGEDSDARTFAELAINRDPNNKKSKDILTRIAAAPKT